MKPITLTQENFDQTVQANGQSVLVDFWAPWCGPCRMLAPVLDEIAAEQAGRVTVAKVDADQNPELASRFGVRALPTLLLFKNGEVVDSVLGLVSKAKLTERLTALQPA